MIGYYVHHHGRGHLHRALTLTAELGRLPDPVEVTVLSSLPRPQELAGGPAWLRLPLDHDDPEAARRGEGGTHYRDPTALGVLHWAPLRHGGLRARMAAISAWIEEQRPSLVVADVSQEVALLCRLHGVPVLSVVQPGHRSDVTHRWGLGASTALCGFWPRAAQRMSTGLADLDAQRLVPLGALSRYPPAAPRPRPAGRSRRVVVLGGAGAVDGDPTLRGVDRLDDRWEVRVLGSGPGAEWVEDPWPVLLEADVAVVHAGQNALAEVAAARVPAVVVASPRPFGEQVATSREVAAGPWPAVAVDWPTHRPDWSSLLDRTARLDGERWASWCDGRAAARFAHLVGDLVDDVEDADAAEVSTWP